MATSMIKVAKAISSNPGTTKKIVLTRLIPTAIEALTKNNCDVVYYDSTDEKIPYDVLEAIVGPDVDGIFCLLTDTIDENIINKSGDNLKVISTLSVGFDHLDIATCTKKNIRVGNTPRVLDVATAEIAFSLMFNVKRKIVEAKKQVHNGGWGTWSPFEYCGSEISNSVVGIVGLGNIGLTFGKMLSGFNCEIVYTGPREKKDIGDQINAKYVSFEELCKTSDIISVHCPLTEETKNLFNKDAFDLMKESAVLINTSRGPVVNQEDLYEALSKNKFFGAGLDVTTPEPIPTDHPLLTLDNCIILPHIGSATWKTRHKMVDMTVENILLGVANETLAYSVN